MLECLVVCTKPLKHTHSHRRERTTTVTLIFIPVQIVHGLKIGKRTCYFIVYVCVCMITYSWFTHSHSNDSGVWNI